MAKLDRNDVDVVRYGKTIAFNEPKKTLNEQYN